MTKNRPASDLADDHSKCAAIISQLENTSADTAMLRELKKFADTEPCTEYE